MGLFDDLAPRPPTRMRCSVAKLIDDLPPEDAEVFQAKLADPRIIAEDIADRLRSAGYFISGQTLMRHRRRICACDRR